MTENPIDYTVGAFIIHNEKILLIHHKKFNLWLQPGGHIEPNEDPEQALHREVMEETGLEVIEIGERFPVEDSSAKILISPTFMDIHRVHAKHKHVGMSWVVTVKSGELKFNEKEHNAIRWFSEEEIKDLLPYQIADSTKAYALAALEMVLKNENKKDCG